MSYTFLSASMDYNVPIDGFADRASFGGMMVLLGMLTIFSVLIIIMLALAIFKVVFHDRRSASPKEESTPAPKAPVYTAEKATNEDEVIAAIAAAIAMAEGEGSGKKFRVVSFRRI